MMTNNTSDENNNKNKQEVDLFSLLKNKAKRIGSRIAFHFGALGISLVTGAFAAQPMLLDSTGNSLSFLALTGLTYCALLLLFPYHKNRPASIVGVILAIVGLFTGYWPIGLFCGALIAFILNTLDRWVEHKSFLIGSVISLILMTACLGTGVATLLLKMPLWYQVLCCISVFRPHTVTKFADRLLNRIRNKWRHRQVPTPAKEESPVPLTPVSPFDPFQNTLKELQKLNASLPVEMQISARNIAQKTQAILLCMEQDPRDVSRGTQFLNRYLPMIQTSVERFNKIAAQEKVSPEFQQAKMLTTQALSDMSHAFDEMHQHLLENDMTDLIVDLKVMDKLMKSDGYSRH